MKNNNVLIVGKPKSGKTTFFAQSYLRIQRKKSKVALWKAPQNIRAVEDAINRLTKGEETQSTPAESNEELILPVKIGSSELELICPDYGGEQINNIIELMEFTEKWQKRVEDSDSWIIFLRPGSIINYYDLSNRGYEHLEKKIHEQNVQSPLSDQCQLIELLQILLYIKGRGLKEPFESPRLAIALTCWDELYTQETPSVYMEKTLPLLYNFMQTNWKAGAFKVYGLSSQEFPLHDQAAKDRYLEEMPENFGFVVLPDGTVTKDITELIKEAIQ